MKIANQFKKAAFLVAASSFALLQMGSAVAITPIALNTSSQYYLGSSSPGKPSSPETEVFFINTLRALSLGQSVVVNPQAGSDTVLRSNNPFAMLPTATEVGGAKNDSPGNGSFTFGGGWSYIVAKYGGGNGDDQRMEFYYTAGLTGAFSVSPTAALSHVSYYNPGPGDGPGRKVPDGGTTVACLGFALLGLGSMRKLIGLKA